MPHNLQMHKGTLNCFKFLNNEIKFFVAIFGRKYMTFAYINSEVKMNKITFLFIPLNRATQTIKL